jgi:predicted Fe-Mo cluster-binding NifX family protein
MIIVIPMEEINHQLVVASSFGRAPYFYLYDADRKSSTKIANFAVALQGGAGVKAAQICIDHQANVAIVPQCGENAMALFQAANVEVFQSAGTNIEANLQKWMLHELSPLNDAHPGFHHHR